MQNDTPKEFRGGPRSPFNIIQIEQLLILEVECDSHYRGRREIAEWTKIWWDNKETEDDQITEIGST